MPPRFCSIPLGLVAATFFGSLAAFAAPELPDVVAKVDGEPVTSGEVIRLADTFILASGKERSKMTADERKAIYLQIVNEIINDRLLLQAAKGTVVTDAEIDQRYADIKKGYGSDAEFREQLIKVGQTEASVRDNIRIATMEEKWIVSQVADKVKADSEEIERTYKENMKTFTTPEKIKASHILIQVYSGDSPNVVAAKEKQANEVAKRAAAGEDFAALAREYSEDGNTRAAGGDLGYLDKSTPTAFGDAAFKLNSGQTSDPVRSKVGFHVIKVTEHVPATQMTLDQVRSRIIALVETEKRRLTVQLLLEDLRKKAKIEMFVKK
jgi:parvulin-like peptidyl-prolyl isomerase